jgi:hypothetical protein
MAENMKNCEELADLLLKERTEDCFEMSEAEKFDLIMSEKEKQELLLILKDKILVNGVFSFDKWETLIRNEYLIGRSFYYGEGTLSNLIFKNFLKDEEQLNLVVFKGLMDSIKNQIKKDFTMKGDLISIIDMLFDFIPLFESKFENKKEFLNIKYSMLKEKPDNNTLNHCISLLNKGMQEKGHKGRMKNHTRKVWANMHEDYKYLITNIVDLLCCLESDMYGYKYPTSYIADKLKMINLSERDWDRLLTMKDSELLNIFGYMIGDVETSEFKVDIIISTTMVPRILRKYIFMDKYNASKQLYPYFVQDFKYNIINIKNENKEIFKDLLFEYVEDREGLAEDIILLPCGKVNSKTLKNICMELKKEGILSEFVFRSKKQGFGYSRYQKVKEDYFSSIEICKMDLSLEVIEFAEKNNITIETILFYINTELKKELQEFKKDLCGEFSLSKDHYEYLELNYAN